MSNPRAVDEHELPDLHRQLARATAAKSAAQQACREAEEDWARLVVEAVDSGLPPTAVSALAGCSRARVYDVMSRSG